MHSLQKYLASYVRMLDGDSTKNFKVMLLFALQNLATLGLSGYAMHENNNDAQVSSTPNGVKVENQYAILTNIIYFCLSVGLIMGPKYFGPLFVNISNSTKPFYEPILGKLLCLGQVGCTVLESLRFAELATYQSHKFNEWQRGITFSNIALWSSINFTYLYRAFELNFSDEFTKLHEIDKNLNRLDCLNHFVYSVRNVFRVSRDFLPPIYVTVANSIDICRFATHSLLKNSFEKEKHEIETKCMTALSNQDFSKLHELINANFQFSSDGIIKIIVQLNQHSTSSTILADFLGSLSKKPEQFKQHLLKFSSEQMASLSQTVSRSDFDFNSEFKALLAPYLPTDLNYTQA